MAKPIAGINDYPYGVCGYVVDGAYLRDGSKKKSLRIYKQRSDIMFDLIDPKTNIVYQKVLITGKDTSGEILDYNKKDDEILNVIQKNTFFVRGYNDLHTREGFVVRFLLNKVILSTGVPIYNMYTPSCTIPLPVIDNIIVAPIRDNDTSVSGTLTSSSGTIDPTDMVVTLTLPDGTVYETTVDSTGKFEFNPVLITGPGNVIIKVTSPNYEEAEVTLPILSDGEDSDYVTSIIISSSDFAPDGFGNFKASIPNTLHLRGSKLVIQLQHTSNEVMFSSVNVDSTGNIDITQVEPSDLSVVIIGSTIDTVPFSKDLVWTDNLDGTYSCTIDSTEHNKKNISLSVYEDTSIVTVDVQIDSTDNVVLTSMDNFIGYVVITGKD